MIYTPLGRTDIEVPPLIFGTSCLGNLYRAIPYSTKLEILRQMFEHVSGPVALDSAGKYGAGLALEVIGRGLKELNISADRVHISNKLGWFRIPLRTPEPTFEPGAWAGLKNDAVQKISYRGILECWEQGCELLGEEYRPQIVSVHDPDEFLSQAHSADERKQLFAEVIDAYRALHELKKQGLTKAVGVGAKDWKVIREITREIDLEWVMLAVSLTVYDHPPDLLDFVETLAEKRVGIINSAVFHAGFLTGGQYFDYRILQPERSSDRPYFEWREKFFFLCDRFGVLPANACVQFGMSPPGVISVALNTSKPERVQQNVASVTAVIPDDFWLALKEEGLVSREYPYLP